MNIITSSTPTYSIPSNATLIPDSSEKNTIVDALGRPTLTSLPGNTYKVVSNFEQSKPLLQKIAHIVAGILAVIFSLGLALLSKKIKALFQSKTQTLVLCPYVPPKCTVHSPPPATPSPEPINAILFTSLTGNPVHKGHIAMIATAVDKLREKNIHVEKALVSFAFESYFQSKCVRVNRQLKKDNLANGTKVPFKACLSLQERREILDATIKDLAHILKGTPVEYWDDQQGKERDHPESYQLLASKNPDRRIYYLAGTDLCKSMGNWGGQGGSINHAIIVSRENKRPQIAEAHTDTYSRLIVEGTPEYQDYSSSAIQQGQYNLLPESVRDVFIKRHQQAQNMTW